MKITLAITIYNKEEWIESLLDSWISNLSGKNEYEVIIVFDDCRDRSEAIAEDYLVRHPIEHKFLHADDKFEIFCNNLALDNATGDYIIFIQDDNWMYDRNWDITLEQVINKVDNVGVIGFLAGLRFVKPVPFWCKTGLWRISGFAAHLLTKIANLISTYKNERSLAVRLLLRLHQFIKDKSVGLNALQYQRIEIDRPHKGENFHNVGPYEFGIWRVDAICRPFCVSRELVVSKGGLDREFMPTHGDDLDLSL